MSEIANRINKQLTKFNGAVTARTIVRLDGSGRLDEKEVAAWLARERETLTAIIAGSWFATAPHSERDAIYERQRLLSIQAMHEARIAHMERERGDVRYTPKARPKVKQKMQVRDEGKTARERERGKLARSQANRAEKAEHNRTLHFGGGKSKKG